jgi:hypothetical protein
MNDLLLAPFTGEEVWAALECIGDLKAPGPDGMPSVFYKQFWNLVGEKVRKEVLQFLNGGHMPQGWNDTMLVLIPKSKHPERSQKYLHIAGYYFSLTKCLCSGSDDYI